MSSEAVRPRPGMWFEDFAVGQHFRSPSRTISEADIFTFGGLTGDLYELHTSETYGKTTPFGSRIAHGMLGLAMAHGLMCRTAHVEGTGIAMLGWDKVRHKAPIRIGDTVTTHWHVIETRESRSRPGAGVIIEHLELINQHGEAVLEGDYTSLVGMRPNA